MPLRALLLALLLASPVAAQDNPFAPAWPATDFSRLTIDLAEVMSGGPPRDGIPAITGPVMIPATAETRLDPREPVLVWLPATGPARAYPIRYLMWHEIVNDAAAGQHAAITFCPLCNTGIVFDPVVAGRVLDFGVSGLLRHSDMIMYDRQTDSWWQQATGEGIAGTHAGQRLVPLLSWMESWESFAAAHPDGLVMDAPDFPRAYGLNPYQGYDSGRPFLYAGDFPDNGLDPVSRVVRVGDRAWPLARLAAAGRIEEAGLTLTWTAGQASALDTARIGEGREVGNIRVRDAAGRDVIHDIPFAFAFHAFHPEGEWMLGE
jgi:Protein of unknown function (DUF3179)